MKPAHLTLCLCFVLLSPTLPAWAASDSASSATEALGTIRKISPFSAKNRIRVPLTDSLQVLEQRKVLVLAGVRLRYRPELVRFYAAQENRPAWVVSGRHALPAAWELLDAVEKCHLEGLDKEEYHAQALDTLLIPFGRRFRWGHGPPPETAAALDLLLTDAYLKLASHLLNGRIHPLSSTERWPANPEKVDLPAYLDKTLKDGDDIRESLRRLAPADPGYGVMKYWLARYRGFEEAGGWPPVPAPPAPGTEKAERHRLLLCNRLAAEGEMDPAECRDRIDSAALTGGLRRFQRHHALIPTGRLDEGTRSELNVPLKERIRQIQFNLEGWRWLPSDLGEKHVRVNITDYSLTAWEHGRPGMTMRVVVGRKEDSTPMLSDRIVSVFLNPPWNVPETIAGEEILPQLQKDPAYLEREGMELLTSWSQNGQVILPDTVDWSDITPEDFQTGTHRFRIRQKAGDGSALGKIKFSLTNPFQVYLHDTPSRGYFDRNGRALSHGCIRVEKPLDLADWLLKPAWTRESMAAEIRKNEATVLPLGGDGIPVHILYWTAFTDAQGGLQFRRDIYGWDRKMHAQFRQYRKRTAGL